MNLSLPSMPSLFSSLVSTILPLLRKSFLQLCQICTCSYRVLSIRQICGYIGVYINIYHPRKDDNVFKTIEKQHDQWFLGRFWTCLGTTNLYMISLKSKNTYIETTTTPLLPKIKSKQHGLEVRVEKVLFQCFCLNRLAKWK